MAHALTLCIHHLLLLLLLLLLPGGSPGAALCSRR
jgi:hypothetical protein